MTTIIPNPGTITTERDHPVHRLMMTTRAPTMPATRAASSPMEAIAMVRLQFLDKNVASLRPRRPPGYCACQ